MTADKPDSETAAASTPGENPPANPPEVEETKRKFREALEAKKGRRGEDHLDAGASTTQPHGPVETKRTFRRKTG